MVSEPQVGHYRYEGWDLGAKHGWTTTGPAAGAFQGPRAALAALGKDLVDSEDRLSRTLKDLGVSWEGAAAADAGKAMQQAAQWHGDAGTRTESFADQVEQQGQDVADTKHKMPDPATLKQNSTVDNVQDGGIHAFRAMGGSVFGVTTNAEDHAAQEREMNARANQVMQTYEKNSRDNLTAMQPLPAPPPITVTDKSGSDTGGGSMTQVNVTSGAGYTAPHATTPPATNTGGEPAAGCVGSPETTGPRTQIDRQSVLNTGIPAPTGFSNDRPHDGSGFPGHDQGEHSDKLAAGLGLGAITAGGIALGGSLLGGHIVGGGSSGGGGAAGGIGGSGIGGAGGVAGKGGVGAKGGAAGAGAGVNRVASGRAGVPGQGSVMQGALSGARGGSSSGEDDAEHENKYAMGEALVTDEDLPLVSPPVIGGEE
ncbi:PPE domain-containing protein [Pseudonocardiaceae bacterium YIM PH 21723]|nr:PPE domain-containing protein [Pseudonocardiaceae bacterium YIM PH 21723]